MSNDETKEKPSASLTVESALKMYEEYKNFWADNYREANIDLKMAAGDPATHWGDAYGERVKNKQLVIVINELPQFIHQVTNDIRQNTPSIQTIPDSEGDIETAQVFSDLMRDIEYKSAADEAYDTAAEYAVKCGIGFIRVDHDYCDDDSDEQELQIKKVPDPLSVWSDPASIESDGRDSNGAICLEPINKKTFERLYPGKKFISFTDPKSTDVKDTIIIAEIFVREFTGARGKTPVVYRYKFSGEEMLAETTFPGEYVPIVPVIGEDVWIDGKRILASLIRQARDPQLRLNHWAVKEQQILNMAPIAPVMAAEGTLVNDRGQWQSPGTETVLEYKLKDLNDDNAPPPQRLQPPPVPTGIINAMEGAKQNIKESLGMYNASIGEKSNETSGIAIQRRQHEGDVATFHFPDNVRRSVTQVARIQASAIPVVYDTPRIIQTMSNENEPKMVAINGAPLMDGQKQTHDLTKGKYRVRVTTGASYTTKRQEEAEFLSSVAQKDPNFMGIGGDLLFKSMDTPGAQALAARYKKLIPPQLLEDGEQPAIPPQVQQALQQLQQQNQELQQQLQQVTQDKSADIMKAQNDQQKNELEQEKLQLEARKLDIEAFKVKAEVLKPAATQQSVESAPEASPYQLSADMPEEQILSVLQQKRSDEENAQNDALMQQQMEAEEKQREMMMEQQEIELKQADLIQRQQQTEMIMQGISTLATQLQGLTASVQQPKQVVRDANGVIVGVQ